MDRIQGIKNHFEEEAEQYDGIIIKLIPYYERMVGVLVNTLPYESNANIEVIDLGCGTGTIARAVKNAYPKAKMTCLDLSANMLDIAGNKLKEATDSTYINADFYSFEFSQQYDAIVSSLALHHIEALEDKLIFYKKIYTALKPGGVFINSDVVLASTETLQQEYIKEWISYMCKNISREQADTWIAKYYEEDRPATLVQHLDMLKQAGFSTYDVVWKYYNFTVYMAVK